jgi:hypothetical protein
MAADHALTINFGGSGNSLGFLGGGWARAEERFTWATGQESHLLLNLDKENRDYILTLSVIPFVEPPALRSQRLIVSLNETTIGMETLARPTVLAWRIPAGLIKRREKALITLSHPDAARPSDLTGSVDDRELAFSVSEATLYHARPASVLGQPLPPGLTLRGEPGPEFGVHLHSDLTEWVTRRTGMSLAELASQFESIGDNCEFGLVQRRCDAEPLGLLRFSGGFSNDIVRGIEQDFEGIGEPDEVEPRLEEAGERREYMVHERRYGLTYHTFVYEDERTPELMRQQEATRLRFLRRKFLDDLDEGAKIFVFKRHGAVPDAEILPLFMALNRKQTNTLLWVVPEQPGRPCGTVEILMDGLLKAYIDRFAPGGNAHDFSFNGWMRVCVNAWLMHRLMRGPS